jgi:hypothetical protein
MLCWTEPQTNWPNWSTLSVERAQQVWRESKHVWASNHRLKSDLPGATKSGQICFSFFFLYSLGCIVCVLLSLSLKWCPTPRRGWGLGHSCLHSLSRSNLNHWFKHQINGAQALGLMPHETELCHARACLTTEKLKKMNAEKFVFRGGLAAFWQPCQQSGSKLWDSASSPPWSTYQPHYHWCELSQDAFS